METSDELKMNLSSGNCGKKLLSFTTELSWISEELLHVSESFITDQSFFLISCSGKSGKILSIFEPLFNICIYACLVVR